jgi:GxxExxY protein
MNVEIRKTGMELELEDRELTSSVIEAAIRVHKALGPGFLESFYEEALCMELANRQIPFERQKTIVISYLGRPIGEHRLDLLIDGKLVVELKAVKELDPVHFSIVRSYMKATESSSGLIFNFCTVTLGIKRVGLGNASHNFLTS